MELIRNEKKINKTRTKKMDEYKNLYSHWIAHPSIDLSSVTCIATDEMQRSLHNKDCFFHTIFVFLSTAKQ